MSYTILTTDGKTLATVFEGTADTTTTSLALVGKNYAGYGVFLNENYVKLLENFANRTPPSAPLEGQLWYDKSISRLRAYSGVTGTQWKSLANFESSIVRPVTPSIGDMWWDTTNSQLYIYSGSTWILVGPLAVYSTMGKSGPAVETILDTANLSHIIIRNYVANATISIISKDAEFTPIIAIVGFTTIKPGINLASSEIIPGAQFTGIASNSLLLNNLSSLQFLRSDIDISTEHTVNIINNTGLTVGGSNNFNIGTLGGAVKLTNRILNSDLNLWINKGGVDTRAIGINGTTGAVTIPGDLIVNSSESITGNLNVSGWSNLTNINIANTILPTTPSVSNIGSPTLRFAKIYADSIIGTAVQAVYADLAERFESDQTYIPGTVVEIGGHKEITAVVNDLSESVFGVISHKAAFLMNGFAGTDATHPPVAVNGRVPVRVIGTAKKGDRLVSAGNGLARAAMRDELTAFNVIGRALEDKHTNDEGLLEAIVKLNS